MTVLQDLRYRYSISRMHFHWVYLKAGWIFPWSARKAYRLISISPDYILYRGPSKHFSDFSFIQIHCNYENDCLCLLSCSESSILNINHILGFKTFSGEASWLYPKNLAISPFTLMPIRPLQARFWHHHLPKTSREEYWL